LQTNIYFQNKCKNRFEPSSIRVVEIILRVECNFYIIQLDCANTINDFLSESSRRTLYNCGRTTQLWDKILLLHAFMGQNTSTLCVPLNYYYFVEKANYFEEYRATPYRVCRQYRSFIFDWKRKIKFHHPSSRRPTVA